MPLGKVESDETFKGSIITFSRISLVSFRPPISSHFTLGVSTNISLIAEG